MITGQNTEIRHEDVAFHVQTEDKGRSNPLIVSLVYVGGQVLVARRTSYSDRLEEGVEEQDILEMMDRQHRTMIAAIRKGKFDDKVKALLGSSAATSPPAELESGTSSIDEDLSLDEMVSKYLGAEPLADELALTLVGGADARAGQEVVLTVSATAHPSGTAVSGVEVLVEFISTVAAPAALAEGTSGDDGTVKLLAKIPAVVGMAALIIRGTSDLGEAEIKMLL